VIPAGLPSFARGPDVRSTPGVVSNLLPVFSTTPSHGYPLQSKHNNSELLLPPIRQSITIEGLFCSDRRVDKFECLRQIILHLPQNESLNKYKIQILNSKSRRIEGALLSCDIGREVASAGIWGLGTVSMAIAKAAEAEKVLEVAREALRSHASVLQALENELRAVPCDQHPISSGTAETPQLFGQALSILLIG
jgi:hypothetical protein